MSSAVPSWTCPQCQRRVPGREPLCHCGFARAEATGAAPAPAPASPADAPRSVAGLVALFGACLFVTVLYLLRTGGEGPGASLAGPRMRGPAGYPALPALPAAPVRPGRRSGSVSRSVGRGAARPVTAVTPVELLELPLRRISADTSVLEMSYRSFAPACLVSGTDGRPEGPGGPWLASLRTAALRPDVILRDGGRSIGCAEARQGLVARADALKAGLDDAAATAREAGIPDPAWRRLLAAHDLAVWDGY